MTETLRSSTDIFDNPGQNRRIFFAGGLGYDATRNRRVLAYLAERGYETAPVLPDPVADGIDTSFQIIRDGALHQIPTKEAMNVASRPETQMVISNYQLARAEELIRTLDAQDDGQVDAIFQSADALSGMLAMYRRPDLFHSAVLAYPAGIVKQPHPTIASYGIMKSIYTTNLNKVPPENSFEPMRWKLQVTNAAIAKTIINSGGLSHHASLLSGMAKQKNAPGVSIAVGTEDWMFRPDQVIESIGRPSDIDYLLVTNTPHGIGGRKDIMDQVVSLFPKMEQMRETKAAGDDVGPLAERIIYADDVPHRIRSKLSGLALRADDY